MLANLTEKKNIVIAVSDIMDLQATGRSPKHCNTLSALSVSLAGTQQVGEGSSDEDATRYTSSGTLSPPASVSSLGLP